jgi:hypothetical protein
MVGICTNRDVGAASAVSRVHLGAAMLKRTIRWVSRCAGVRAAQRAESLPRTARGARRLWSGRRAGDGWDRVWRSATSEKRSRFPRKRSQSGTWQAGTQSVSGNGPRTNF